MGRNILSHANVIDLTEDRDLFSPSPVNRTTQFEAAPPILPGATMANRASAYPASQQLSGRSLAHKIASKGTNGTGWSPQNQIHNTVPERPAKKQKINRSTHTPTPQESTQSQARELVSSSISPPPDTFKDRFSAVLQTQVFIHITAAMQRHQRIIAEEKLKEIGQEVYTFTTLTVFEAN
jgi:hypothetical protein